MKTFSFSLIGRSGCGKGTQADLLMKHFGNLLYISTGGMLREFSKLDTAAGRAIKKLLVNGELIPDFVITGLWMRELCINLKDDQGFLFDGAPRRVSEAEAADQFLDLIAKKNNFYPILLDISKEEAFNRLTKRRICKKCGRLIPWVGDFKKLEKCDNCGGELYSRPDDNPEAINNRLEFYDKDVSKVVDYYNKDNRLITINGDQPIDTVFQDILKALKKDGK